MSFIVELGSLCKLLQPQDPAVSCFRYPSLVVQKQRISVLDSCVTYCTFLNWPHTLYVFQLIKGSLEHHAYDLLSQKDLIGQHLVYLYWHSLMGWLIQQ
jgi:hypothetical protein